MRPLCILFLSVTLFGLEYAEGKISRRMLKHLGKPAGNFDEDTLPGDQWTEQLLDHFDPTNLNVWWQRYQMNATWFKGDGPAFLFIGGEGDASPYWMVTGTTMDYAQQYNALAFQLEHRFYGKSHPTKDMSTENLKYLTSEQALGDIAYFIQSMNQRFNLSKRNKWIVFGGSYSGSLAAWARIKYPHLIYAAVSTSGPLLAEADFIGYNKVVENVLHDTNPECSKTVHKAALRVNEKMKSLPGLRDLSKKFNLCSPLDPSNGNELSNFAQSLAGTIQGIVQYNNDFREGNVFNVKDVCDIMLDKKLGTPVERYAALQTKVNGGGCLDVSYYSYIQELLNVSFDQNDGDRQWIYQTCTEFGFYQTSSTRKRLFGGAFNLNTFINVCKDAYGLDVDLNRLNVGIKRTHLIYGRLDNIDVSRVLFVQGSADPWHVLGINHQVNSESPAIVIENGAHCSNLYPPSPDDSPQLKAAIVKIGKIIGQWVDN